MTPMTKEALAELRRLASIATPGPWEMEGENIWFSENGYTKHLAYLCQGDDVDDSQDDANTRYVAVADPTTVLALLDELEAKEKRIAELEDQLSAGVTEEADSLREQVAELQSRAESAEQALYKLAFVARRYLPDYDEHPEIQSADDVLERAAGITLQKGGE